MSQFVWGYVVGVLSIALAIAVGYSARTCGDRYFDAPHAHRPESAR